MNDTPRKGATPVTVAIEDGASLPSDTGEHRLSGHIFSGLLRAEPLGPSEAEASSPEPLVSVVTRTCGERLFLERVLDSLSRAAPDGTQWIIVDDSGSADPVLTDTLIAAHRSPQLHPIVVRSAQRHRAKAANAGLAAICGRFVHILDDDDTIEPGFYSEALKALAARPELGAIAARALRIDEALKPDGSGFVERRRRKHYPEIKAITLAGMLVRQYTPLCSILFRTAAVREVGPFDETLAVCEDHAFLLRFLIHADIGLLDQTLFSFHTRVGEVPDGLGNSGASSHHAETDGFFRNAMLRRSLKTPLDPLGFLLLAGEFSRGASKFDRMTDFVRTLGPLQWLVDRLRKG